MDAIIESVPNVSEAQNSETIQYLAQLLEHFKGIYLLGVDPNIDANRTVFTLAGPPDRVVEALFQFYVASARLIDMRHHKGAHIRNGAVDVCPLVPVQGVTMNECVILAQKLGQQVAQELEIPVYLYGEAATSAARVSLANLRRGQYEALPQKLTDAKWRPDFGPHLVGEKITRFGATQIGARPFLIAWNVNLSHPDVPLAKKIARQIRETGTPGLFKELKAMGWSMPSYGVAQVTMNLTNYRVTGLGPVYHCIDTLARKAGSSANGSELIGLVPEAALLAAGRFTTAHQSPVERSPDQLVERAIDTLGLNSVRPFDPEQQIFERVLRRKQTGG